MKLKIKTKKKALNLIPSFRSHKLNSHMNLSSKDSEIIFKN